MSIPKIRIVFLLLLFITVSIQLQANTAEQRTMVAMRMIGHELLLSIGDTSSRVLPIKKEGNTYQIQFESSFQLNNANLVHNIDSIVNSMQISKHYLVEVNECASNEVVYSYEIGPLLGLDKVPCRTREQEAACYSIFFTALDAIVVGPKGEQQRGRLFTSLFVVVLLSLGGGYYFYHKNKTTNDPDAIAIGAYWFNAKKMQLAFENEQIELSSKETDLLNLLYHSANETLEREHILKEVWGDEGSYVGRTLDVFISKLRKKLAADEAVKIVNVRGVGYKLMLD